MSFIFGKALFNEFDLGYFNASEVNYIFSVKKLQKTVL